MNERTRSKINFISNFKFVKIIIKKPDCIDNESASKSTNNERYVQKSA